jgi:arylformamidase
VAHGGAAVGAPAVAAETADYDFLYNPRLVVQHYQAIFDRWDKESQRARARLDGYLDVPYGADGAQSLDVFRAIGPSRALLIYIHGGYWRSLDKALFSFLAPSLVREGVTVAIPNYALCPSVQVADIVMQIVQACAWLHRNGTNFGAPEHRVFICGHSAGGHLAAMMLACVWPQYSLDLPRKVIRGALSISGLYDLTEIVKVPSVNSDVRLDEMSALKVSPVFLPPATDAPLYTAVGGEENQGFRLQNELIGRAWYSVRRRDIPCPGDNHFTVLDRLCDSNSPLFRSILEMTDQ